MNRLRKLLLGILVLSAILLSGCAKEQAEETGDSGPEAAAPAKNDSEPEAAAPAKSGSEQGAMDAAPSESAAEPVTFEGTDLEGNTVSSDIFSQSKLTMINIWATYCNPCLNEMPGLGELAAEYDAEEFQIIGIVSDVLEGRDQTLAESLVQQTGASYVHLLLNESLYYALLKDVSVVPTTFFLDQDGTLLDTVVGAMEKSAWEEKINGLLEGQ